MDHHDSRLFPEITHKLFARRVSKTGFYTGNVTGDGQLSSFIRAFTDTGHKQFAREPGDLQRYDLKQFGNYLPGHVRRAVEHHLRDRGGVLYCIRHYDGNRRVEHGWILMDYYENELLYRTEPTSAKSESCMAYALSVIHHHAVWHNGVRARHCFERAFAARHPELQDF